VQLLPRVPPLQYNLLIMQYIMKVEEHLPVEFKGWKTSKVEAAQDAVKARYLTAKLDACRKAPTPDQFWSAANRERFPLCASVLGEVLPVPATNVVAESLFSHAGLVLAKRRQRLSNDMLATLTILHYEQYRVAYAARK
jgi:hypothetical protein